MKKFLIVATLFMMTAFVASAQAVKFGRINASEMIILMPETDLAQVEIENYEKELGSQINTMREELKNKYGEYQQKQGTTTALIRQQMEQDITDLQTKIEGFTQAAQKDAQDTAMRLMAPIREKVLKAITDVAKLNSVTVVIDMSQPPFIYIDEAKTFDMTSAVKVKLNIVGRKLPAQYQQQQAQR